MSDRLVFVGTGVSTGIPVIGHCAGRPDCCCADALANPSGPNRRNNVSMLITRPGAVAATAGGPAGAAAHVLIDCGKTFRDAYFRVLQPRGVDSLAALLLTHDHADAINGVDDLRDMQQWAVLEHTFECADPISVFLSQVTLDTMTQAVPYIVNTSPNAVASAHAGVAYSPTDAVVMKRRATCLNLRLIDDAAVRPLVVPGLLDVPVHAVPVLHGGAYRCSAFVFGAPAAACEAAGVAAAPAPAGAGKQCVVYLSDVSEVPAASMAFLAALPRIDVLVVDVLHLEKLHYSHFGLPQAWALVQRLQPVRAFGVGMWCELEHAATNALLAGKVAAFRAEHPDTTLESFELAYDGLELTVDL
jgi:phosphoribosyl 1,2-cyclic phosphodiesterase